MINVALRSYHRHSDLLHPTEMSSSSAHPKLFYWLELGGIGASEPRIKRSSR